MSHYDRIAASAPINRQAAQSTSQGTGWTPIVKIVDYFEDMPPLSQVDPASRKAQGFIDFVGMTFGRLTVVGKMAKTSKRELASWVCRCKCGGFCTRKAKSLKVAMRGGNTFQPMCGRCQYQNQLAAGWSPTPKGVRA